MATRRREMGGKRYGWRMAIRPIYSPEMSAVQQGFEALDIFRAELEVLMNRRCSTEALEQLWRLSADADQAHRLRQSLTQEFRGRMKNKVPIAAKSLGKMPWAEAMKLVDNLGLEFSGLTLVFTFEAPEAMDDFTPEEFA